MRQCGGADVSGLQIVWAGQASVLNMTDTYACMAQGIGGFRNKITFLNIEHETDNQFFLNVFNFATTLKKNSLSEIQKQSHLNLEAIERTMINNYGRIRNLALPRQQKCAIYGNTGKCNDFAFFYINLTF